MDSDDSSPAESLFAEHLARASDDDAAEFEVLCREHPEQADDLRRLRAAHALLHADLLAARPAVEEVPRPSLFERLCDAFGEGADPGISLQEAPDAEPAFSDEVIARLALRAGSFGRYRFESEVARGGMGTIVRVWDEDLRRSLAMKLIRARRDGAPAEVGAVDSRTLARFLEEAQVTGQLDHPGIVPVHELGLDADGRVYFTMKLVEGRTLQEVFEELARGEGDWTQARVLGLLLRVCEAVSYAHSKGVIHRDLKPANVMVGRFGEVYVMDWGLARVLGHEERKDIRVRPPEDVRPVRSERVERAEDTPGSPLLTMDGHVLGTPAYMPPEQARGEVDRLDERADVYALGAMVYQLLAGRAPYLRPGERPIAREILARVIDGPPEALQAVAPGQPAELAAICEKAMARDAVERYADTSALGDDLRAFVEGRVVQAYRTGAWAEMRKWTQRNRPLAASLLVALTLAIAGLGGIGAVQAQERAVAEAERGRADREALEAKRSAKEAEELRVVAEAQTDRVLRLSDARRLQDLEEEASRLWPAHPEKITALESWLERATPLLENIPLHRRTLEEFRVSALPRDSRDEAVKRMALPEVQALARQEIELEAWFAQMDEGLSDDDLTLVEMRVEELENGIGELEDALASHRDWSLPDKETQWQHDVLAQLVDDLDRFGDPDPHRGTVSSVRARVALASEIAERTTTGSEAGRLWEEATAAIASSPRYAGLTLDPQIGLVPLGADPGSGLWEFAHLNTGEAPARDDAGELILTEACGIVLVLLPRGSFWMGAQSANPAGPNFDRSTGTDEQPLHRVELDPFFLAKHEMTQAQWKRATGSNPSYYGPEGPVPAAATSNLTISPMHPVDLVSRDECVERLFQLGLVLPTEAQWEYGHRGGTQTPWWTGEREESLVGAANLSDLSAKRWGEGALTWDFEDWLDDGSPAASVIGSYLPNGFGLHDTVGNVIEWCADGYGDYVLPVAVGTGERLVYSPEIGVLRGSAYNATADLARSAYRYNYPVGSSDFYIGLRPARALTSP